MWKMPSSRRKSSRYKPAHPKKNVQIIRLSIRATLNLRALGRQDRHPHGGRAAGPSAWAQGSAYPCLVRRTQPMITRATLVPKADPNRNKCIVSE